MASFGKIWNFVEELNVCFWSIQVYDAHTKMFKQIAEEGFTWPLICTLVVPCTSGGDSDPVIVAGGVNGKILLLELKHYSVTKQIKEKTVFSQSVLHLTHFNTNLLVCASATHIKLLDLNKPSFDVVNGGSLEQRLKNSIITCLECTSKGLLLVGSRPKPNGSFYGYFE